MGVTVCLPLFGHPGRELEEGRPLKGRQLRDLAEDLHARLLRAAGVLDKLEAGGWTTQAAMFDVLLHHPAVGTREEAVARLRALEIDPEQMMIVEDVEEDEDEGA
jgi:hypothetical protein